MRSARPAVTSSMLNSHQAHSGGVGLVGLVGQIVGARHRHARIVLVQQEGGMIARVVEMLREHRVAGMRQILGPGAFGAERPTFDDRYATAVIRAAVEVLDGLQLRRGETVVAIDVVTTHVRAEVAARLEVAGNRIVDHAVGDAVTRIATP